jgi:hypothetical protein
MISSTIPYIIAVIIFSVTFVIAARALYLYVRVRSPRLFILGLAMGVIGLTGAGDFTSMMLAARVTLHTDWFLYIGQAISYLFIFLSLVRSQEEYQQSLMRWHIVFSVAAICLLLLSPVIPDITIDPLRVVFSGSRCILCFCILLYYALTFASKQTRFSLLMSLAFLFLSFGYLIIVQKYFSPQPELLDNVGDLIRMGGFAALLIAVIVG